MKILKTNSNYWQGDGEEKKEWQMSYYQKVVTILHVHCVALALYQPIIGNQFTIIVTEG